MIEASAKTKSDILYIPKRRLCSIFLATWKTKLSHAIKENSKAIEIKDKCAI